MTPIVQDRELTRVPVASIKPNPKNPRQAASFTEDALDRLRISIREHGVLEPLIVMADPDEPGKKRLIEGERRLRVAQLEGLEDLPVVVVNDMDEQAQVVTMFNIHMQRKAWETAEELVAVREVVENNGHQNHDELAKQLGMSVGTFRDRLSVLGMGPAVIEDIATGKVEYTAVLRSHQTSGTIARHRPKLVEKLGGEDKVEQMLLDKAKARKRGVSQELVQARADLADTAHVPDAVIETYLRTPESGWRDLLKTVKPADDRRKVREIARRIADVEAEIRSFEPHTLETSQLSDLRRSVVSLMVASQELEQRIVDALLGRN